MGDRVLRRLSMQVKVISPTLPVSFDEYAEHCDAIKATTRRPISAMRSKRKAFASEQGAHQNLVGRKCCPCLLGDFLLIVVTLALLYVSGVSRMKAPATENCPSTICCVHLLKEHFYGYDLARQVWVDTMAYVRLSSLISKTPS